MISFNLYFNSYKVLEYFFYSLLQKELKKRGCIRNTSLNGKTGNTSISDNSGNIAAAHQLKLCTKEFNPRASRASEKTRRKRYTVLTLRVYSLGRLLILLLSSFFYTWQQNDFFPPNFNLKCNKTHKRVLAILALCSSKWGNGSGIFNFF